jgi:hypothetical protein
MFNRFRITLVTEPRRSWRATIAAVSLVSLVLAATIFTVPAFSVLGVWLGARSLSRRSGVPRLVPRVAYTFAAGAGLIVIGGSVSGVLRSMGAVSGDSGGPSQKARMLGEGISEAMNCGALGFLVAVVGAMWLGFWAWRSGRVAPRA